MVRATIGPKPELLDELELEDEELLDELELELEDELELEELELLLDDEDELELLEPVPPHAVSAVANNSAGTTFILWYFQYTFI